jgi:uncharacterized protein (TIGR01244 family)
MGRSRVCVGLLMLIAAAGASAQQVTKEKVAGISNFSRLETTVACAGPTSPDAMPAVKGYGFASVINLRQANEPGENIAAGEAAAKAAGLKYFHIPVSNPQVNGKEPEPEAAAQFLKVITTPGVEPAFIYCGGGSRAASMWFIKRVLVDRWSTDRAMEEAAALGLANPVMKRFALDYVKANAR